MDFTAFVRSLPAPVFVGAIVVLLAMGGVAVTAAVSARRRAAILSSSEPSAIAFAEDGVRTIEGQVEAAGGLTLSSPLTGVSCCWFSVSVEAFAKDRQKTATWRTVRQFTSGAPFLVRDQSGACAVYPAGADLTPTDHAIWTGPTAVPANRSPDRMPGRFSASPTVSVAGTANTQFRYREACIYPGDPIAVVGDFYSGRFTATADHDEGQEDADDVDGEPLDAGAADENPEGADPVQAAWEAADRYDEAAAAAGAETRAWMARAAHPLVILATVPRATDVAMQTMGAQAALWLAGGFAGVAALLCWVRWG